MTAARLLLVLLVLALAAAPLAAAPGGGADEASRSIARALFDEARTLAEAGEWKAASELLAEARAHDGADSHIRYLSALAARAGGASLDAAIAELDAAFAAGRFACYDEAEARVLAAELLLVERRWAEALGALPKAAPGSLLEPRRRLARAKAFLGQGDEASYASELGEALRRFPDDPRFPRLLFSRLPERTAPAALRPLVELSLSRIARYSASDPELPALAAPFMPDRAAATDAVLAFRAVGGTSPAATLLALEYGLIDEAKAASELLSGLTAPRLEDIRRALSLARSDEGRAAFASALASYSGRIESDLDVDGFAEAQASLAKGLALSFALDRDQNGEAELELAFSEGLPASALVRTKGATISIEYAAYPLVAAACLDEKGGKASFELEAGELAYAPVAMSLIAGKARAAFYLPEPTGASAPSLRSLAASALSRKTETGEGVELLYLDRGIPERRELRSGGRLVSVTDYRLGMPERERADMDGDGRFETERYYDAHDNAPALSLLAEAPASAAIAGAPIYAAPAIAWARVDADGDGIFEYREEARFPFRKEWDLDANGSVDAVQYEAEGGSIRSEYSSRLDGRFDEILTLRRGEIVQLEKGGHPVALVPDANTALVWIGAKPFDLGPDLPAGEGVFVRGGQRYRLVRVGSRAFAEAIQ